MMRRASSGLREGLMQQPWALWWLQGIGQLLGVRPARPQIENDGADESEEAHLDAPLLGERTKGGLRGTELLTHAEHR